MSGDQNYKALITNFIKATENFVLVDPKIIKDLMRVVLDSGTPLPGERPTKGLIKSSVARQIFQASLLPSNMKNRTIEDLSNWLEQHQLVGNFDWENIPRITTALSSGFKTELEPSARKIFKLWGRLVEDNFVNSATIYCRFTAAIARSLGPQSAKELIELLENLLIKAEKLEDEAQKRTVAGFVQLHAFVGCNICPEGLMELIHDIARRHRQAFSLHSEAQSL